MVAAIRSRMSAVPTLTGALASIATPMWIDSTPPGADSRVSMTLSIALSSVVDSFL